MFFATNFYIYTCIYRYKLVKSMNYIMLNICIYNPCVSTSEGRSCDGDAECSNITLAVLRKLRYLEYKYETLSFIQTIQTIICFIYSLKILYIHTMCFGQIHPYLPSPTLLPHLSNFKSFFSPLFWKQPTGFIFRWHDPPTHLTRTLLKLDIYHFVSVVPIFTNYIKLASLHYVRYIKT